MIMRKCPYTSLNLLLISLNESKPKMKILVFQNWLTKNVNKVCKDDLCLLLENFCYEASALSSDEVKFLKNMVNSSLTIEQKMDLQKLSWKRLRTVEKGNVLRFDKKPFPIPNKRKWEEDLGTWEQQKKSLFMDMKMYMKTRLDNHPLRLLTEGHFPFLNQEVLDDLRRKAEIKVSEDIQRANVKSNNETVSSWRSRATMKHHPAAAWEEVREIVQKCIVIDNRSGLGRIFESGDDGIKFNDLWYLAYGNEDDIRKKFCEAVENVVKDQDLWNMLQKIILENIPYI